ncbi:hypothetical protein BDV95DRAFT_612087 [Massariosphaeria phaeospora]|uniref:Uncharacterized protein n=1 Tax=Massariosphaeria phaeospora TaxID=100035 RepID=A0A7C8I7A3_9PLEO|nr:hypothetical protein BDV95DRAFT_612087 [Massariosphaeria phaeospora]
MARPPFARTIAPAPVPSLFHPLLSIICASTASAVPMPSTKPTARRKRTGATSASSSHFKNGTRVRDPYPLRLSQPSSTPDSYRESSISSLVTYSVPNTEAESLLEPNALGNVDDKLQEGLSDTELDSEGDVIMADIAECEAEGPTKPLHTRNMQKLWKREGQF